MASQFRPLYRSLLVSVAIPLIIVQVLLRRGVPSIEALAIAAIFPFADALVDVVRARRVALVPGLSLFGILVGIGLAFVSSNASFAVARESVVTAIVGLAFLGSLATTKPLIFRFARQFAGAADPAEAARLDGYWELDGFRAAMRLMTLVWGVGLLAEAVARVVVAFTLPPATSTLVVPALSLAAFAGLIAWSFAYVRAMRRRAAARGLTTV